MKVVPANGQNQQRPQTAHNSPLKRSQTLRNTLRPPSSYATSDENSSRYDESKRESVTTVSGYTGNMSNGDLDSSMNTSMSRVSYGSTMDKDIMYLRALKVGDRVIVEIDKNKGKIFISSSFWWH